MTKLIDKDRGYVAGIAGDQSHGSSLAPEDTLRVGEKGNQRALSV
jgi:hypothetical protein